MRSFAITALLLLICPLANAQFKDDSEAGVVITGGNTSTQSYNFTDKTDYLLDANTFRLDGHYLAARSNGVETAENWSAGLRYERALAEMVSAFAAQDVESDKFSGYLQRYNSDLGGKYYFFKKDKDLTFFTEDGLRFTHEHDTNADLHDYLKGRVYLEAEKYWAPTTSTKLWVEYLPNFSFGRGWLLNSEASVSSALSSVFSIKTAYLVKYNNAPPTPTAVPTDTQFTTSLVAKF
jgi:putative salt-induced outer membrane protein